ncbi:hypothetical protein HMPREF0880_01447 [Yokenella regensburgei ATCC 43003]|nr:hypothetical protein HMPREF0880_01447 [Yokenella regensburgei ATCC 43003]
MQITRLIYVAEPFSQHLTWGFLRGFIKDGVLIWCSRLQSIGYNKIK